MKVHNSSCGQNGHMRWLKVWDTAVDHGPSGTNAVLSILKLLSKTVFADRKINVMWKAVALSYHLTLLVMNIF